MLLDLGSLSLLRRHYCILDTLDHMRVDGVLQASCFLQNRVCSWSWLCSLCLRCVPQSLAHIVNDTDDEHPLRLALFQNKVAGNISLFQNIDWFEQRHLEVIDNIDSIWIQAFVNLVENPLGVESIIEAIFQEVLVLTLWESLDWEGVELWVWVHLWERLLDDVYQLLGVQVEDVCDAGRLGLRELWLLTLER